MAKQFSNYVCQQCEYSQVGWAGKCPECGTWGSLVETIIDSEDAEKATRKGTRRGLLNRSKDASGRSGPVLLKDISVTKTSRLSSGATELDRALGGGIVPGQVVLLAGEPGIGKSTILLQVAGNMSANKGVVFYASAEESAIQLKLRAERLGVGGSSIKLLEETDVDSIVKQVSEISDVSLLVIDSIQTIYTNDLRGFAGSVGQIRECTYRLVNLAKSLGIPTFIVGHVTKEGTVAGPAVLAHLVDTVLWFEGDKSLTFRMIRAVKNRFGPTDEVGMFEMRESGLVSLDNPEGIFISDSGQNAVGSAVTSIMQGLRTVLVEVQALVVPTKTSFPRRVAQGIDSTRLELLLAVLTRRCSLPLYDFDCYVNISGGIAVKKDPSIDLAVCLAVASAYLEKPLPDKSTSIGEVGLLGDIRKVSGQEKREKESRRLGYKNIITSDKAPTLNACIKKFLR